MKTLKTIAAVALALVMGACGQKTPSAEEVANRVNTNQELTEADYTAMIDYCGKYAKEAQQYFDIINAQPNDSTNEAINATNELAGIFAKYPYLQLFRDKLTNTELSALGAENERKVNEYAAYQAFPLPMGEGTDLENPDVVGMIEQTPSVETTDTTGVVATGVGEAVRD